MHSIDDVGRNVHDGSGGTQAGREGAKLRFVSELSHQHARMIQARRVGDV